MSFFLFNCCWKCKNILEGGWNEPLKNPNFLLSIPFARFLCERRLLNCCLHAAYASHSQRIKKVSGNKRWVSFSPTRGNSTPLKGWFLSIKKRLKTISMSSDSLRLQYSETQMLSNNIAHSNSLSSIPKLSRISYNSKTELNRTGGGCFFFPLFFFFFFFFFSLCGVVNMQFMGL